MKLTFIDDRLENKDNMVINVDVPLQITYNLLRVTLPAQIGGKDFKEGDDIAVFEGNSDYWEDKIKNQLWSDIVIEEE